MAFVNISHLVAGLLTFFTFVMLINMIKKDFFDSSVVEESKRFGYDAIEVSKQNPNLVGLSKGPFDTKPCWIRSSQDRVGQSKGFIIFSLAGGAEYHVSQIANAVLVAKLLKATLVLPDISGHQRGDMRKFEEIYDVHKFVTSLNGVVSIAHKQPGKVSGGKPTLMMVPNGASDEYVTSKIEPVFRRNRNLKLVTYFPTSTTTDVETKKNMDLVSCLAVFEALRLQPKLQEVVDSMLESIRTLSRKSESWFVAVDFRLEMLGAKGCLESTADGRKHCYSAGEIGQFLKKIGFEIDTTIYFTQDGWHHSLDAIKNIYPNTFTKESLLPAARRSLITESPEFSKAIDFHICSHSDVFVPVSSSNLFYTSVVGMRIASGRTNVLVPSQANSVLAVEYMSSYITNKTHSAYSCFC